MKRKTRATPAGVPRSRARFTKRERSFWFFDPKHKNKRGYEELRERYVGDCVAPLRISYLPLIGELVKVDPLPPGRMTVFMNANKDGGAADAEDTGGTVRRPER